MTVECIFKANQQLAEGPLWHAGLLYWVDIKGSHLHRLDPVDGAHVSRPFAEQITSISPRLQGGFVITTRTGFALLDRFDADLTYLGDVEPDRPGNRFNDAKVDGSGLLWSGTMDDKEAQRCGSLYRLDAQLQWQQMDAGYLIPNGPTFSPDGLYLYHTDSAEKKIFKFDYNAGALSNKRLFITLPDDHGYPDGMTVDANGDLWVCEYAGWGISHFSAAGDFIEKLALPVANVTSCTFGGPALDTLYITTAAKGLTAAELAAQPLAGSIFSARPGVHGLPVQPFRG